MDSSVYRFSDKVNNRTVQEMVEIASKLYLRDPDARSLADCVDEIIRARFSDHPLWEHYRLQVLSGAQNRVDEHRRIQTELMIKDSKRLSVVLGYGDLEESDSKGCDFGGAPSDSPRMR